jgi:hypothetical protein
MSNEIKIEDIERDDHMYEEKHHDKKCHIEEHAGTYTDRAGELRRTLKVQGFVMVCNCYKQLRNPLLEGQPIMLGESVDLHLHNKRCSYKRYPICDGHIWYYVFKCYCYCRPSLSYPGRS